MLLYSLALTLALLVSAPVWAYRMARQGRYREGLGERLGAVPQRLRRFTNGGKVVWVHAVSVGEVFASVRLVRALEEALPGHRIVVSTTTPTGQKVARERFGVDRVFFYPLDFAFAVRAYLHVLQPDLVVLMESELWPRMLVECERAGVPLAVVNARVSDRSRPRYRALRLLWRPLLVKVRLLLAQSEIDRERWVSIGAPAERVRNTGNLKYDIVTRGDSPLAVLLRGHLPAGAKVLVCGSTHAGEEAVLLACFQRLLTQMPDLFLVLAPRHPERCTAVAEQVRAAVLPCLRLSEWRLAAVPIGPRTVLLVDTVGELAPLYSLASVAFVGGSLVPQGGHNPLEPAQFGVPVVMGRHYENFRAMVDAMRQAGAIAIADEAALCDAIGSAMHQDDGMGRRAAEFYRSQAGATDRTVQALQSLLAEGRTV